MFHLKITILLRRTDRYFVGICVEIFRVR